jgi:hypothetical protein
MTTFSGRVGASESILEDGRVIVPGEKVDLTPEQMRDPHNKRLIDDRHIIEVKSAKKKEVKT